MKQQRFLRASTVRPALLGLLGFMAGILGCLAEEPVKFRKETSEILLIGSNTKWEEVQLRRTHHEYGTVAYQWVLLEFSRDRRGQGSFTAQTSSLLNIFSKLGETVDTKAVEVIAESADRLELKFSFEGDGQTSELHMVAARRGDSVAVTFKAKGELAKEFVGQIEEIKTRGENPENDLSWHIAVEQKDAEVE